jgi:lipoprotein-releasing system ATP-binding protein
MNSTAANRAAPLVEVAAMGKTYRSTGSATEVLRDITFDIHSGEMVAIVGPSGAGKSTLLNILGTLDRPTCGTVRYRGQNLFKRSQNDLAAFRNRKLGFVFQFHHLLPEFTALENTMMPALIAGHNAAAAEEAARTLLVRMGLEKRLAHKQGELSGGEQQRVAVARALVMTPEIVLADEPTGNLDTHTGQEVFSLLLELNRELGMTLIIVTHNQGFSRAMPRSITLVDGSIVC